MMKTLPSYAPVILRLGMAAVFVWFGVSQLINSGAWVGLVPVWATNLLSMSAFSIVHLNGWFEIIMGSLLAVGILVRWVALILSLHLFVIASSLGTTAIGIRDFGLSIASLSVALSGNDRHSIEFGEKKADF